MYRVLLVAATITLFASPAYAYEGAHLAQPTPEEIPLVSEPAPQPVAAVRTTEHPKRPRQGKLSESEVRTLLENACEKYGITGADMKWLITAGLKVAWSESRYNPSARNSTSSATGLFQFLKSWGSAENRLDPVWSANRFARVFRDGGKPKIRQHWRATIGTM